MRPVNPFDCATISESLNLVGKRNQVAAAVGVAADLQPADLGLGIDLGLRDRPLASCLSLRLKSEKTKSSGEPRTPAYQRVGVSGLRL